MAKVDGSMNFTSRDCPASRQSYTITGFRLCCGRVSYYRNEFMKIHEYQAKSILSKYGVAIPRGEVASSREEAEAVAKKLFSEGATGVVVKAQIHAGGRGKGGGVKIAKSVEEAGELASRMLGKTLVTHQTGPEGRGVRRLLIEGGLPIGRGLKPEMVNQAVAFLNGLYKAYLDTDASLVEINPLITTKDNRLIALDAKLNFDDNALFRHKDIKELRDVTEE